MNQDDPKSTGQDYNDQGTSKPSDGSSQGRTPQGGGQGSGTSGDGKSGDRDSSQPGGQND